MNTHLTPSVAWDLWKTLNDLAEALWDAYEHDFLNFCIHESDLHRPCEPLPFEDHDSALPYVP